MKTSRGAGWFRWDPPPAGIVERVCRALRRQQSDEVRVLRRGTITWVDGEPVLSFWRFDRPVDVTPEFVAWLCDRYPGSVDTTC